MSIFFFELMNGKKKKLATEEDGLHQLLRVSAGNSQAGTHSSSPHPSLRRTWRYKAGPASKPSPSPPIPIPISIPIHSPSPPASSEREK